MRKPRPVAQQCGSARHSRHNGRIRALPAAGPTADRRSALGRLLPLWPHELEDESAPTRLHVIARLRKALRAERRRGLAGHWTYDLARHVELLRLYRAELAALRQQPGNAANNDRAKLE